MAFGVLNDLQNGELEGLVEDTADEMPHCVYEHKAGSSLGFDDLISHQKSARKCKPDGVIILFFSRELLPLPHHTVLSAFSSAFL